MATASAHFSLHKLGIIGLYCLSLPYLTQGALASENLTNNDALSGGILATQSSSPWTVNWDLGWDSKYLTQGRDNLPESGIYWMDTAVEYQGFTTYVLLGRADNQTYTEWNLGLEYALNLSEHLAANLGYQRIQVYGDDHCQDNELFAEIAYTKAPWLVPSIAYVYSTEAKGAFVELSLHSYWDLTDQFTLSPYITQGLDFGYSTQEHDGRNHLQWGLEANYTLNDNMSLSGHISHSLAQTDIEQEAVSNGDFSSQNQTYAGLHFNMSF